MKDQQQHLFNQAPPPKPPVVPSKPGRIVQGLKVTLLATSVIPVATTAFFFLWGTLGEAVLPVPYRFSTFIGKRISGVKNEEITGTLAKETEKQDALAAANGIVDLRKGCVGNRNQTAQQVYTICIQQGGFISGCEFQRDEVMQQPCDYFTASDLSKKFPGVQGGNHD